MEDEQPAKNDIPVRAKAFIAGREEGCLETLSVILDHIRVQHGSLLARVEDHQIFGGDEGPNAAFLRWAKYIHAEAVALEDLAKEFDRAAERALEKSAE
jgi:hypothetical protein